MAKINVNNDNKYTRTPYKVEYYEKNEKKVIKRVSPPKLHSFEINDFVTIKNKKNDDWNTGDEVYIKDIKARNSNVLQVEKEDGTYTFLSYFDVESQEEDANNTNQDDSIINKDRPKRDPIGNDYLLWP